VAKICALNNYPLLKMWELAERGAMPRQHLWGIDALAAAGHVIDVAPFHEPHERNLLDVVSSRSRRALGHLDQEAHALRRIVSTDVVYCADQTGLAGLALARGVLGTTRLVSVVHHPVHSGLKRRAAARHDALLCLSEALASQLERDLMGHRARIVHVPWGPDLSCPLYRSRGEVNGVVSAGKSNRDLTTLARALSMSRVPAVVYDLAHEVREPPTPAVRLIGPGDLEAVDPDAPGQYLPTRVLDDIAAASVVAVPVRDPERLTGLTEVADALAFGKPVVMSRSPYFPFDIEAVGCGIWVEPGDAGGWARAISQLDADRDARVEMGAAGRRFAERYWNYECFCASVCSVLPS
jgi:glycosyltransferase involved in cell wall biosynthesis